MRVTAGELRGRVVKVAESPGLRPTPAKVRQALFNILGLVDGFRVLDLFAGSGIMALESISRGADAAISIELQRKLTMAMNQLREQWGIADRWQVRTTGVEQGLKTLAGESFDLVFADPPYRQGLAEQVPAWLDQFEIGCDQLVVEEASNVVPTWPSGWLCVQSRRYGDSTLHFLLRK